MNLTRPYFCIRAEVTVCEAGIDFSRDCTSQVQNTRVKASEVIYLNVPEGESVFDAMQ